jgi:hypothetical protein
VGKSTLLLTINGVDGAKSTSLSCLIVEYSAMSAPEKLF